MSFSDYWENAVLNHLFGKAEYTPPTIFVGLSLTAPGETGSTATEPSGGSYARVETEAADWNTSTAGLITNANEVTFAEPTGTWGTVMYVLLYDAATAGNFLGYGQLVLPRLVLSGSEAPSFAAGLFSIGMT